MGRLKFSKLDRKFFVRPLVYSTVAVLSLFLVAGFVVYYINISEFHTRIKKQQEIEGAALKLIIHKYVNNMKKDVAILTDLRLVKNFVVNPAAHKLELYRLIKNVVEKRNYHYQLRILDLSGHEIFRVNYVDNKGCLIPDDQLQDKSKRDYYLEAIDLVQNQITVSDYDYNIERQRIERPLKTTLRVTTPIYVNNDKKAYMVVNFNTDVLTDEIKLFNRITQFDTYIVNDKRQFMCYKTHKVALDYVYDHYSNYKDFIDRIFSQNEFFSISDAYFYKIKIFLNEAAHSKDGHRHSIYLAVELPPDKYLAYKKDLLQRVLLYTSLLFIATLAAIYIFLFLLWLINRRSIQLRKSLKLLELSEEASVIANESGIIEYVNPAFEAMFRCSAKDTVGCKISRFKSDIHDEDFYAKIWERLNSIGKWEGDIVDVLADNSRQVKHLRIEKISDPKSGQLMYLGIYKDITKLQDSNKLIKRLNSLDYLTGLPNKRTVLNLIDEKIKNISATDQNFSVSSISIYNLKEINDSYGFDIGDKTVLLFVERMKGRINQNDILGRIGDNHFLLVVSNSESCDANNSYMRDLFRNCTASAFNINEWEIYLSINVGVSCYPANALSADELIKAASLARPNTLPDDKLAANFYSEKMFMQVQEKSNMLSLLEKAVQRQELYLEFQPKADSKDGSVVGSEALIRWNNAELGVVPPSDFIALAEENGLISRISYWVIRELCAQIKTWLDNGVKLKPVSFNLSLYDFEKEDFPEYLFACVEEYCVDSKYLQIEITERVLAKNKDKVIEKIAQLREQGFKVLIDDFGTGYSSLEYLREFKIDILKIDRAFIKDYPENSDGKIVKTICDLARSLEMEVICEGVETKSQLDFVNSLGCHVIQGFYYSAPVSAEVFTGILAEGNIDKS